MNLVQRTIDICYKTKNGHLASSITALPIIKGIYETMELEKDIFILSKGHACPAWYAVLEKYGYHPDITKVHPDIDRASGIHCTTGSLGHGLPIACGMAYADQKNEVYVLLGDGECAEGTTWESLLFAQKHNLENLHIFIDENGYQALGRTIYDGMFDRLCGAFPNIDFWGYNKIKGAPLSIYKDHPDWHVHHLTEQEYETLMKETA